MRKSINKKGEAGIGTLILLIALVLVAAVAASVILQTSSSLQSKSLATGSKSQAQISTQIIVMRVWAENGTTGSLGYIFADFRLGGGSDSIDLNTTSIEFLLTDDSMSAIYNSTVSQCNQTVIDQLSADNPNTFAVEYAITAPSTHVDRILQQGEIARICFPPPRLLTEKKAFRLYVLPKNGEMAQVRGTTPDVITETRSNLFPN